MLLRERVGLEIVDDLNRRRFLTAAGAAAVGLGPAGCGSGPTGDAASGPSAAGFPVTVQGTFGPTVVPAPPKRVLTLGNGPDADTVRALGVRPVAMNRRTSFPDGFPPWPPVAPGEPPIELIDTTDGLPFERIAALAPDLIVATTQYSLDRDHDRLARIAPVLAYTSGPSIDQWPDSTVRIGEVLGRRPQAERLVMDGRGRGVADLPGARRRGADAIGANPLCAAIPAMRRGSYVVLDAPSSLGIAFPSTPALDDAIDRVVGPIAKAVR